MLPKKHRLSKSAEVKKTTAKGRSFFNPYFVIKSIKGEEPAKVTVIVSTKVSKKAVVRNRIKRAIRDEVGKQIDSLQSGSYAIIVKAKASGVNSIDIKEQITLSLKAIKNQSR